MKALRMLMLATAFILVAMLALIPSQKAGAQTCPDGQRIIGMTPGGNGSAPMPICGGGGDNGAPAVPNWQGGYSVPPPTRRTDVFGTWVIDAKGALFYSTGQTSLDEAEAAAMGVCQRAGGSGCRRMVRFGNQCAAYAEDAGNTKIHLGLGDYDFTTERNAMAACKAENPTRKCRLITLAVCAGTDLDDRANERASKGNAVALEAATLSADNAPPLQ